MSATAPVAALAATVILLRETQGLEVLMVRRGAGLAFGANALVFPGGRVDPSDADAGWRDWAQGAEGLSDLDLRLKVAAARELFEETGVLLTGSGSAPGPAPDSMGAFAAALSSEGARLDLRGVVAFSRWVTPAGMARRFDTYFFVVRAPEICEPVCDGQEAVAAEWIRPDRALALDSLMVPTRKVLERLVSLGDLAGVERAVAERPDPELVEPTLVDRSDGRYIGVPATRDFGPAAEIPLPSTGG